MTIIKNETQRLNLNAAQIWVAFPVLVLVPRTYSGGLAVIFALSVVYKINMHTIDKR